MPRKGEYEDLTGKKYGRLTVIEYAGKRVSPSGSTTPLRGKRNAT